MEKGGGGNCDRDGYPPPSLLLLFSRKRVKGFWSTLLRRLSPKSNQSSDNRELYREGGKGLVFLPPFLFRRRRCGKCR